MISEAYKSRIIWIFIALIGLTIGGVILIFDKVDGQAKNENPNFINNLAHLPKNFAKDFTLTKHDGTAFKFSSLKGKPVLMYFGFTHCPDFCPASLQVMDAVAQEHDVHRVFITVDPQRDTTELLSDYVGLYASGLIGLTGSLADIDKVAKDWYVYYSYNKKAPDDKDYIVDHSTYLYLLDSDLKIIAFIRPDATPEEIIAFINRMQI